jgi:4-carboxymuconolactone decarboxylase
MSAAGATSSQLPLVDNPDDPVVRQHFEALAAGGGVLNLHRMMAHAPVLMKASGELAMALRHRTKLPRALAEMIILRIAQVYDCDYVWVRHLPLARACGVTEQKIEALARWRDSDSFTEQEKAAIEFCEIAIHQKGIEAAHSAAFRRHFSPQEMVEIVLLAGNYVSTVIFVKTLAVPPEKRPPKSGETSP